MLNCRSPRGPAANILPTPGDPFFSSFFRIDFLMVFFMDFTSIFGRFFNDFSCFFHYLFEAVFLMIFYSFLGRSLNWANPKNLDFSLVFMRYFALGTFRRRAIFRKTSDKFQTIFALIFHQFS